jgi:hypothetical protein
MPYPSFRAGQRVTAALLNAGKMEFVTNSAGAQTNTTTTMADATDLVFAAEANSRYKVTALISYNAPIADANGDIKFEWTAPSGASMGRNVIALSTSLASTNLDSNVAMLRRGTGTDQVAGGSGGGGSSFSLYMETVDLVVGGTAGDVQFRFALNAGTGTATLQADSVIYYQRIG